MCYVRSMVSIHIRSHEELTLIANTIHNKTSIRQIKILIDSCQTNINTMNLLNKGAFALKFSVSLGLAPVRTCWNFHKLWFKLLRTKYFHKSVVIFAQREIPGMWRPVSISNFVKRKLRIRWRQWHKQKLEFHPLNRLSIIQKSSIFMINLHFPSTRGAKVVSLSQFCL